MTPINKTEELNPMELAAIDAVQPVPDSWRPYYFDSSMAKVRPAIKTIGVSTVRWLRKIIQRKYKEISYKHASYI